MKKITKITLLLAILTVAVFGMATMTYADDVSNAKEVEMVVVDDLAEVKEDVWPNEFDFVKDLKEASKVTTYYKITLDTPSRINIKSFINATQEAWMGGYNMYISTSGVFTEEVQGSNTTGTVKDTTLYLDKGTYFIRCEVTIGEKNIKMLENAQGYFGIFQEKMTRSGAADASTMKNAMSVNSGKYGTFVNYGVCNKYVEQQWLKVVVKTKSDFTFNVEYTKPQGYLNTKVFIHDKNGQVIRSGYNKTGLSIEGAEPGVYYIEADGYGTPCQMKITTTIKDVYPPEAPKVTAYKSGTKSVSGKAEANSTVYVKYNKKTYKTKAASNGTYKVTVPTLITGNSVSVYCVDQSNNKSKSTVVKVKNIRLASPKVTTYKNGTKVVKGTAKKGLTVYVKYNGKTYKAKAASNGKYSVKTAKLLSKKTVLVYVKDAYNNSSSAVKVTVK